MASHQEQTRWLTESAGVFVTSDRVVRVRGEDAVSWLNGQVTADVRALTPGHAAYALTVTLKGRVQSDLWAIQDAEGVAVVLPAACAELALEAFEKHIIMEDVELVPEPDLRVITVQGPRAGDLIDALFRAPADPRASTPVSAAHYTCPRLPPRVGADVWVPSSELEARLETLRAAARALGGGQLDEGGWAHAHVMLAAPRAGIDFGTDSYPQEAGLKARAVSFSKGCYTGQEVVYMLEKRGQVSRRLVQLIGSDAAPASGAQVLSAEGARVGEVTSATQDGDVGVALAYLKRAQSEPLMRVRIDDAEWEVRYVVGESDAGCPIVAST